MRNPATTVSEYQARIETRTEQIIQLEIANRTIANKLAAVPVRRRDLIILWNQYRSNMRAIGHLEARNNADLDRIREYLRS